MVIRFIVIALGYCLWAIPFCVTEKLTQAAGSLIYWLWGKRRREMLSNLYHAFPEKPEAWRRKTARISCQRMIEMGLFALISPHWTNKEIRERIQLDETTVALLEEYTQNPSPGIALGMHSAMMEACALVSTAHGGKKQALIASLYRPLKSQALNQWLQETREKHGFKLFSRKTGMGKISDWLRSNHALAIFFDQNAGNQGTLSLLFDRVCMSTGLPDMLAQRYQTRVIIFYPKRTGFWRATIETTEFKNPTEAPLIFQANQWLENKLRESDAPCQDWLWLHKRWQCQNEPRQRFQLSARRNALPEHCEYLGHRELPRKTRYWIRMPNWLGDILMAIPLIKALRESRPDATITLLVKKNFIPFLETLGIAENILALPPRGLSYFKRFWAFREAYPDVYFIFTHSARGDLEAWLTRTPQRFGLEQRGKKRPLLTHSWKVPQSLNETQLHQNTLWEKAFRYFGLKGEQDFTPLFSPILSHGKTVTIGLICGTENAPEKRWPITHWRALIKLLKTQHPEACIKLYGTAKDAAITAQVQTGFTHIHDLAGKTDLLEFSKELRNCNLVICNDTGGMHLASAVGTPLIALFGPTNPIRTGPLYTGLTTILQPKDCPKTGGAEISEISPEEVSSKVSFYIKPTHILIQ